MLGRILSDPRLHLFGLVFVLINAWNHPEREQVVNLTRYRVLMWVSEVDDWLSGRGGEVPVRYLESEDEDELRASRASFVDM